MSAGPTILLGRLLRSSMTPSKKASASAHDAQATKKQFAKTGAKAIQAHIQARGQRQQARRDAR